MLVQTQTKSKSRLPLLIVLGLVFAVTAVVIYRTYFGQTDIDLSPPELTVNGAGFATTFDTDVLEDVRVKGLQMHGNAEVQVQERGRKPNPFQPF